MKLKKIIVRRI